MRRPLLNCIVRHAQSAASRAHHKAAEAGGPKSASFNPRWFAELGHRISQCLARQPKTDDGKLLRERLEYIDKHWLELSAGREGFLTSHRWRGLDKHTVVWGEMVSGQRHVNNVIYNRYAESARVNWLLRFAAAADPKHRQQWSELMTPKSVGLILRSIKTDYKLPITYPDSVTVLHKLAKKPHYNSDAIFLEAVILSEQHRRPAARCFEDIAVYDYRAARRAPLQDFMVDRLREIYDLQEKSREEVESEVVQLTEQILQIEGRATHDSAH
ncbi:thioesterase-like superfamily protein [Hirsutella rhossiliensis]|uniref:Thioesterase-like superfamily domain-containing protein n=1 Tax=Hirsutella rhossiliensis TaxID=111463 RepID=A0A9P8SLN7_9HYPO|nr:thioesterase-like superfamily domain-containing protein [Hirsutella rhossiliensis]KAH0967683.1 thioesterase-like superfamily domain-containing protein [Hirsutella rhossiliensis]